MKRRERDERQDKRRRGFSGELLSEGGLANCLENFCLILLLPQGFSMALDVQLPPAACH